MSRGRHARATATQKAVSAGISVTTTGLAAGAIAVAGHSAPTVAASVNTPVKASTVAFIQHAAPVQKAQPASSSYYTVESGDTLSSLASRFCGDPYKYQSLAVSNHLSDPNYIYVGQNLVMDCDSGTLHETYTPPSPPSSESDDSYHTTYSPHSYSATSSVSHYSGSSSMQQCIISRESGGNADAMNASGHYGLYQFSESTWTASGGNPADFGHASVSEQNQVFDNAVAARGYSDWAPYDGCLCARRELSDHSR